MMGSDKPSNLLKRWTIVSLRLGSWINAFADTIEDAKKNPAVLWLNILGKSKTIAGPKRMPPSQYEKLSPWEGGPTTFETTT